MVGTPLLFRLFNIMKQLKFYSGVTKKHSLHLGTTEFLRAEVDPNSTPSSFSISARALRDMTDHFSSVAGFNGGRDGSSSTRSENQLGWMFGKNEVRLKSWEGAHHALSTEIRVDVGEFDHYWVEVDRVDLTLPMKELGVSDLGSSPEVGRMLTLIRLHWDYLINLGYTSSSHFPNRLNHSLSLPIPKIEKTTTLGYSVRSLLPRARRLLGSLPTRPPLHLALIGNHSEHPV